MYSYVHSREKTGIKRPLVLSSTDIFLNFCSLPLFSLLCYLSIYLLISKLCSACTISLTHKVIAKECCDCQLNLANLNPAFICDDFPFVLFICYGISSSSQFWRCRLSLWVSSCDSALHDEWHSLFSVCLMYSFTKVKKASVIFTSQCSCNIQIFGYRPQGCNVMGTCCLI